MELALVEDSPAAGSTPSAIERRIEDATEPGARVRMARRRPWARIQLAVDDLRDEVIRHLEQVFVRGRGLRPRHVNSIQLDVHPSCPMDILHFARCARRARQSMRRRDDGVLTAVRNSETRRALLRLETMPPEPARHVPNRKTDPCPRSAWLTVSSPRRQNDENSHRESAECFPK
jgi:hypothetical protein